MSKPRRLPLPPGGSCCPVEPSSRWLHAPRAGHKGDILYQWHTSRKATCLDELLGKNYRGNLQTDAYAGYPAWAAGKDGIDLSNCWAHAHREFHEALKIGQRLAAGPLATIQKIYRIETELRERGATADERAAVIFTMVECAKRHGHDPEVWLAEVLDRLPAMTNRDDLGALLPSRWQPATAPTARTAEACPV